MDPKIKQNRRTVWTPQLQQQQKTQTTPEQTEPQAPQRPEGVSESDWEALGDPGKAALVRERSARQAAENALAAERQRKTEPPKPGPPKPEETKKADEKPKTKDDEPNIEDIVKRAVEAATAPFLQREQEREANEAARGILDAVTQAASELFHDPSDAVNNVALADLTNGAGQPDPEKIKSSLEELIERKPHLAKVGDTRRHAPNGSTIGGGQTSPSSLDDRVKGVLELMKQR